MPAGDPCGGGAELLGRAARALAVVEAGLLSGAGAHRTELVAGLLDPSAAQPGCGAAQLAPYIELYAKRYRQGRALM